MINHFIFRADTFFIVTGYQPPILSNNVQLLCVLENRKLENVMTVSIMYSFSLMGYMLKIPC